MSANIAIQTDLSHFPASLKLCIYHAPCQSIGSDEGLWQRTLSALGAALSYITRG